MRTDTLLQKPVELTEDVARSEQLGYAAQLHQLLDRLANSAVMKASVILYQLNQKKAVILVDQTATPPIIRYHDINDRSMTALERAAINKVLQERFALTAEKISAAIIDDGKTTAQKIAATLGNGGQPALRVEKDVVAEFQSIAKRAVAKVAVPAVSLGRGRFGLFAKRDSDKPMAAPTAGKEKQSK